MKPRLLDLFCGAGGCAMGYHRAGFEVIGVDNRPQKHYPFEFHQMDWLEGLWKFAGEVDVIHASPPCQCYSIATVSRGASRKDHLDLVAPCRQALLRVGLPYIMENVVGAPVCSTIQLCGLMFGLKVFRHRLFECSNELAAPCHPSHRGIHIGRDGMCCVAGHGDVSRRNRIRTPPELRRLSAWKHAMQIDWMTRDELAQAIPPVYTEYIGRQLIAIIQ